MLIWPVSLSLKQRRPCSRSWSMCSKALHFSPDLYTHLSARQSLPTSANHVPGGCAGTEDWNVLEPEESQLPSDLWVQSTE